MSRKGIRKPVKVVSSKLWKQRRKQQLQSANQEDILKKKAALIVRQLRRAAKKGKTIAIRKVIKNINVAREAGKDSEKLARLEEIFTSVKSLDLDLVVCKALGTAQNIRHEILPDDCMSSTKELSDAETEAISMVVRTATVQAELKALSDLFVAPKQKSPPRKQDAPANISADSNSDASYDSNSDSDESMAERNLNRGKRRRQEDSDGVNDEDGSDSEPEDVSALIGERPVKNRPGQRTRRKMILQKFGANAMVFQKERERKLAQKQGLKETGKGGRNSADGAAGEGLHPSWAAKQRVKAQLSAALRGQATGGKRIKLHDDEDKQGHSSANRKPSATEMSAGKS